MVSVSSHALLDADLVTERESSTRSIQAVAAARVQAIGAILGVAMLKLVMLVALFTQTDPYPPLRFAPLFSASLALSVFAIALLMTRSRLFVVPVVIVILESLLSVGPQKLYPGESDFFAQTPAVYPVIFTGTALLVALGIASYRLFRAYRGEVNA